MISFRVQGEPKAQPRVKAFRRGAHASVYTPDTADAWKALVAAAAAQASPPEPFRGAVHVRLAFFMPRPKRLQRSPVSAWHGQKPDVDNLAKAVLDAMAETGWWLDDAQVAELVARKLWARAVEPGAWWTGVEVTVDPLL